MAIVVWSVLKKEKQMDRYLVDGAPAIRKQTRRVAAQAFWYLMAFLLTWIASTMTRIIQSLNARVPFAVIVQMAIFLPAQGFLNFLVYIRPRWQESWRDSTSSRLDSSSCCRRLICSKDPKPTVSEETDNTAALRQGGNSRHEQQIQTDVRNALVPEECDK